MAEYFDWSNDVEIVTAEEIGIETPRYVRNIYDDCVSNTVMAAVRDAQKASRETIKK